MAALKQTILLAGKSGAWMECLSHRFLQEDYEVLCLSPEPEGDEADERKKALRYTPREADVKGEDIFRVHHVDTVIYIPHRDTPAWGLADLERILGWAVAFGSGSFYLLSTAQVFPPGEDARNEDDAPGEGAETNRDALLLEECVRSWRRVHGLNASILRFSEIYGPGLLPEDGFAMHYAFAAARETSAGTGDDDAKQDLLFIDDAIFAVYQAVARGYSGECLHVSSGAPVAFAQFRTACQEAGIPAPKESLEGPSYGQALLSNERCKKELGWNARKKLAEGLQDTYRWAQESLKEKEEAAQAETAQEARKKQKELLIPYAENLAGCALMVLIAWLQKGTPVNPLVYFDMNYLYIGTMGLLYGKRQSLIAAALSCAILCGSLLADGANLVALLYMPQYLLHFSSYLFVAVLTGYFADLRTYEKESAKWLDDQQTERYEFQRRMFKENVSVKDKLYRQIVNSDDSIGRLYRIIRRLDSVETEDVFTQAASVTSEVLDVRDVAIYVMSRDRHYLRQRVRLGKGSHDLPRSQRVDDFTYLRTLLEDHHIFVNRELEKNVPDLAAPILYENEVIAVIEIFGMDFDQWSLYQQNLLSITSRLIASSLTRAYRYEAEMQDRKYYGKTRILQQKEFCKILDSLNTRREIQQDLPLAMLRIQRGEMSYEEIDRKLGHSIRLEDYVGILNEEVYILLPDVTENVVVMVRERLEHSGILTDTVDHVA